MTPVTETLPPAGSRARRIVDALGLAPHPERGFYRETYRATALVGSAAHGGEHGGERSAATAIYFLVTSEAPTTYLHRLRSDEIFHLYEGGPLDILRLFPDGAWDIARLGTDLEQGERPQIVLPAGTWFGTALVAASSHCLVGCTVAPGFEFFDFELAGADAALAERYPAAAAMIQRLLPPDARSTAHAPA